MEANDGDGRGFSVLDGIAQEVGLEIRMFEVGAARKESRKDLEGGEVEVRLQPCIDTMSLA